ncbi:proline--tRNA ligase [Candidatus Micrarchaeota archaeon]|nr:proline--tRNA ligase [Candidatus Micrarchaeota archaeon]
MATGLLSTREFNVSKREKFSEWYNTVIYAADLVDSRYNVQGFLVHKPWATRLIRGLYSLFEPELEKDGHEPVVFPTVIPKENFELEKEHVAGFVPQVFWVTRGGEEEFARPLALRPTSETAFYQMFALWIRSPADLPLKLYQSCSVFRYEHETLPFLRGREFLWIETHDVFATEKEARAQLLIDSAIATRVLTEKLGIPLMAFLRPQWDRFPGGLETVAYDVLMPDGKINQVGSTHILGQNFTKAFGVKWTGGDGKEQFPWSTCFGPGIWRMAGALVSVHGDDKGLILPLPVAPVQVVIVPILKSEEKRKEVLDYCLNLQGHLRTHGLRAKVDDSNKSPGFKYNYWELKGVPLRIEVGEREVAQNKITIVRRDTREKLVAESAHAFKHVEEIGAKILDSLRAKAEAELKERITTSATDKRQVKAALDSKGGFVRVAFCSIAMDGEPCASELQEFTQGGKVRGHLLNKKEKPDASEKCVVCGKKAHEIAYVAKQY